MFALEFSLPTGRYAAACHTRKNIAEWPPHPARMFAAAVNAVAEQGNDDSMMKALAWLESLGSPQIYAPEANLSPAPVAFVPVNSTKHAPKEEPSPPYYRTYRERVFPVARPSEPRFAFRWNADIPEMILEGLKSLIGSIVRIGHSSSFVIGRVLQHDEAHSLDMTWLPTNGGSTFLRCWSSNQIKVLDEAYKLHGGSAPRALDYRPQAYAKAEKNLPCTVGTNLKGDWICFRTTDRQGIPGKFAPLLTQHVRRAFLANAPEDAYPGISGHDAPDIQTRQPEGQVAFVPLPFAGFRHADGTLKGVAVLIPHGLPAVQRMQAHEVVAKLVKSSVRVRMERYGFVKLEHEPSLTPDLMTLAAGRWFGTSKHWATVTPIALSRFPKSDPFASDKGYHEAAASLVRECGYLGLPPPKRVRLSLHSFVRGGVSVADSFHCTSGNRRKYILHAWLEFEETVQGPVILGAGRFRGWGLAVPCEEEV